MLICDENVCGMVEMQKQCFRKQEELSDIKSSKPGIKDLWD